MDIYNILNIKVHQKIKMDVLIKIYDIILGNKFQYV